MFRTMTHVAQKPAVRQAFDTLCGNKLLETVNSVLRKANCKLYFCNGKYERTTQILDHYNNFIIGGILSHIYRGLEINVSPSLLD